MADFFGNLKGSLKENLGNLGKTLSDTAEVVTKKTKDEVEVQKIKSQIRGMERSNEIIFKKGEVIDTAFVDLCEAIEGREEAIADSHKLIADLKGLDVCPNCKEHVAVDVVFCPKCGTKVEREIEVEVVVDDEEDIFEEVAEELEEIVEELKED